jgi:ABC-type Fe3+-hydroxamate transport system substrate-binding protein
MLRAVILGVIAGAAVAVAGCGGAANQAQSPATVTATSTATVTAPNTETATNTETVTNTETQTVTATETTTETVTQSSTETPPQPDTTASSDCNGADPCPPRGPSGADGTYNCADFDTQQEAQDYYDQVGDTDGLDANHDGIPCESLP